MEEKRMEEKRMEEGGKEEEISYSASNLNPPNLFYPLSSILHPPNLNPQNLFSSILPPFLHPDVIKNPLGGTEGVKGHHQLCRVALCHTALPLQATGIAMKPVELGVQGRKTLCQTTNTML